MDLAGFLRLKGADVPAVVAAVNAEVGLRPDDALLAVGSLVEGMGNVKSDVDLLLLTPRDGDLKPDATLLVGGAVVDVLILRVAEIEALFDRFATWSAAPWSVSHPVKFSLDERKLLHRLLNGQPIHRGKKARILDRVPSRAEQARLKLHVARQAARTIQVDMVGLREAGDDRSLAFAAMELGGHAVDGLAAGYELTNPLLKWRSRMLDFLPRRWEAPLLTRPSGLPAGEAVWNLLHPPKRIDVKSAAAYAARVSAFARAVFAWAEMTLVTPTELANVKLHWPRGTEARRGRALPALDFDVDFFLREDHVLLGRLNEFGETLALSPEDFAVAMLCDGRTSASEAARAVYRKRRGAEDAVRRVAAELERMKFTFRR